MRPWTLLGAFLVLFCAPRAMGMSEQELRNQQQRRQQEESQRRRQPAAAPQERTTEKGERGPADYGRYSERLPPGQVTQHSQHVRPLFEAMTNARNPAELERRIAHMRGRLSPDVFRQVMMTARGLAREYSRHHDPSPTAPHRQPSSSRVPRSPASELWDARTARAAAEYQANPRDPRAAARAGVNYYYSGNLTAARAPLEQAVRGRQIDADVMTAYGGVAHAEKDYDLARDAAKIALKLEPGHQAAQALYKFSEGRISANKLPNAIADAGLVVPKGEPEWSAAASPQPAAEPSSDGAVSAGASMDAAEMAGAAAASRQAEEQAAKLAQSAAKTRDAAQALGIGDHHAAYQQSAAAIRLNDRNAQAWNIRAMAATNLRRYDDAVQDASYAIGLDARQPAPFVTRSWAFARKGEYAAAEKDARAALELAPESAPAYHGLAFALAGQGQRAPVVEALGKAAAKNEAFRKRYEDAVQLAPEGDMMLLFAEAPQAAQAAAPPPKAQQRGPRFVRLALLSLSGGLLVALGLIQISSGSLRDRLHATLRRALAEATPAPAPAAAREPGTPTGFWEQYEKKGEIGAGGMGLVYEARDRALDRRVAVKRMRDEIRRDPHERARFVQEARTVAALRHPSIVEIYSIVEEGEDVYLVFEYVPGKTLSQRLGEGAMSFSQARAVMAQICGAVEYAHQHKVIHRDIKPSNIMLTDGGPVKVMDFGVARQAKDAMTKAALTNTIVGTPPYMAPEQEQGTVRKESDVFALGVVLFELLTGELPFQGVGAGMLLNKISGRHQKVSERAAMPVPAGLDDVLAKALAADPDRRYATPAELLAALEALDAARA